eukprot:8960308-Pyramimonas_sp.AAC.1
MGVESARGEFSRRGGRGLELFCGEGPSAVLTTRCGRRLGGEQKNPMAQVFKVGGAELINEQLNKYNKGVRRARAFSGALRAGEFADEGVQFADRG